MPKLKSKCLSSKARDELIKALAGDLFHERKMRGYAEEYIAFVDSCVNGLIARVDTQRKSLSNHKEYIELLLADRQRRLNRKWWQFWLR